MMDSTTQLDRLDRRILKLLTTNGRMTHAALGEAVGLSSTAVARRQRALEEAGLITGYEAKPNPKLLGLGITALIKIKLASQSDEALEAFERAILESRSIIRCDLMSGSDDYLITVLAASLDEFAEVHRAELSRLPGVTRMESAFVLRPIMDRALPPNLFDERARRSAG